jgi:hypothetical protein
MILNHEQKNKNILSRFDTEKSGSKIRKYEFEMNGKKVRMINMDNATLEQAKKSLKSRWGELVQNVKEC